MANDVYRMTHSGLAGLVSQKAATQLLEKALKVKGYGADTVSRREMKAVLLGPLIRDLETILPPQGVKHSLRRIYSSLPEAESLSLDTHDEPAAHSLDVAEEHIPDIPDLDADTEAQADLLNEHPAATPSGEERAALFRGEADLAEAGQPVVESSAEISSSEASNSNSEVLAAPQLRQPVQVHDEAALGELVLHFAQLEHVRLVMGTRLDGRIVLTRGSAEDTEAIARLGTLGLKLLSRSGHIRSYYLAHSQSQLFLFPVGDFAVTVIGSHELNLGEVFSTLSLLEEDV